MFRIIRAAAVLSGLSLLAACGVQVGGGPSGPVYGAAGPGGSGGTVTLHHCAAPVATVAIETEQEPGMLIRYGLPGNPLPAMRLIAAQSGCFRIVNRGVALQEANTERQLAASGELQQGSGFRQSHQMVAADYTLEVQVLVNQHNGGGIGAASALLRFVPYVGGIASVVAGGMRFSNAQVLVTLVNNHTSVQEATVTGKASGTSFSLGGGAAGFGLLGGGALGAGGYNDTAQGRVVEGAMVDAVNHLEAVMPPA